MRKPGVLIAIEGIDGTGKSTQVSLLAEELSRRGYEVVATREPTSGPYGQRIRELYNHRQAFSPAEELELFMADRREHVREVIEPALAAGKIVLTDRYFYSTAAYQGAAGLDPEAILRDNEAFAPIPDLVLLPVVPPAVGIDRIRSLRKEQLNDFEQEQSLHRVAAVFNHLQRSNIVRLDGLLSIEELHRQMLAQVDRLLVDKGLTVRSISAGTGKAEDGQQTN